MDATAELRMEEILCYCSDWRTPAQVESYLFDPPRGASMHKRVRTCLKYYATTGRMESRWEEGIGTQYRTVPDPKPPQRHGTVSERAFNALVRPDMATSQVAHDAGLTPKQARHALERLERRRLVRRGGWPTLVLWSRAEPQTLSQTPSQETETMVVENVRVVASDVDIGKATLEVLLERAGGQRDRIAIPLAGGDVGRRNVEVLDCASPYSLRGKGLRARIEDGRIVDIGNLVDEIWLVGERPTEAEACEMDRRNEP